MSSEPNAPPAPAGRNRYDLAELSGAFGDLGTLVPFVVAYLAIVKMDPGGVLLGFGGAMIATGLWYRTPFPVQPMKAIGAAAATQAAGAAITPAIVVGSGVVTAVIWLVLGATGLAKRVAEWIPRPALLGVVLGLGFSFMLEGIRMMSGSAWLAAALLAFALLAQSRLPVMLLLLAAGSASRSGSDPALAAQVAAIEPAFRLPAFAWPSLSASDLWLGAVLLALRSLPLTFGNALARDHQREQPPVPRPPGDGARRRDLHGPRQRLHERRGRRARVPRRGRHGRPREVRRAHGRGHGHAGRPAHRACPVLRRLGSRCC